MVLVKMVMDSLCFRQVLPPKPHSTNNAVISFQLNRPWPAELFGPHSGLLIWPHHTIAEQLKFGVCYKQGRTFLVRHCVKYVVLNYSTFVILDEFMFLI